MSEGQHDRMLAAIGDDGDGGHGNLNTTGISHPVLPTLGLEIIQDCPSSSY
jgi:hypothetical protein